MAEGWTTQVAAAAGVAATTGAAQLGLGYGLGVVVWPSAVTADDSLWLGSLGWATWIAASSTVFGAVVASRFSARRGGPWRFALAASAAVGALLAVALIALPARFAVRPDTFSPETIAGGYAAIGVLFGLVIAYWAVVSRPVAANLIATAVWLWAMAVAAVVVELTLHRASATYLSSWQFADPGTGSKYGTIYWPSSVLTLLAALVIGAIGALPGVRRGELGVGAAASGAVGPLLVAASFFVLAPQLTGALGPLESAYLIAPYAVLAGLSGSAIVVGLAQKSAERHREPRVLATERSRPRTATGVAAVPAPAEASHGRARGGRSTAAEPAPASRDQAEPTRSASSRPTASSRPSARGGRSRGAQPGDPQSHQPSSPQGAQPGDPQNPQPATPQSAVPAGTETVTVAAEAKPKRRGLGWLRPGGTREVEEALPASAAPTRPEPVAAPTRSPESPAPSPAPGRGSGPDKAPQKAATHNPPTSQPATQRSAAPQPATQKQPVTQKPEATQKTQPAKSQPSANAKQAPPTRSTVTAPPSSPPIVKINPPRSGDSAPTAPSPTKATKATKAPPPKPPKAQPAKPDSTPDEADTAPLWVDDSEAKPDSPPRGLRRRRPTAQDPEA